MKPLRLYMKNIGPFRDETIDFTALDNMFLIKGDTGAGKTFIFDALTFALYGKLRGNRKDYVSDLKSHYAREDEESYVDLEFELGGERYRINRNVPFNYINRNGKRDQKKPQADLSVWRGTDAADEPGLFDTGWELLPYRTKNEVDEKVQELLGLSADEFAKIVVLPQGEFAEFLHQNSKERAVTLKKLFPVTFYSDITARFKEKADKANDELRTLSLKIEGLSSDKDFTAADEMIARMTDEFEQAKKTEAEAVEKRDKLSARIEQLRNEEAAAREFGENRRKKDELESLTDEMKLLAEKLSRAERARDLREFIMVRDNAASQLEKSRADSAAAAAERDGLQEKFSLLDEEKASMEKLRLQNEADGKTLSVIQKQLESAEGLEALKKNVALALEKKADAEKKKHEIEDELASLKKELGDDDGVNRLEKLSRDIQKTAEKLAEVKVSGEEAQKRDGLLERKKAAEEALSETEARLEKEEETLASTKTVLQSREDAKKAAEASHQAWTVAQFLKEGEPCPVCGSVVHPHPAEKPEGLLSYDEEIKILKDAVESITRSVEQLKVQITAKTTEIKGFGELLSEITTTRTVSDIQADETLLKEAAAAANADRERVSELMHSVSTAKEALDEAARTLAEADGACVKYQAQIDSIEAALGESVEELRLKETKLISLLRENGEKYSIWRTSYDEAVTQLAEAKSAAAKYAEDVISFSDALENAGKTLAERVTEKAFSSVDEAVAAYLSDDVLAAGRQEYQLWKEALAGVTAAVEAAVKKNLRQVSEVEAEMASVSEEAAGIREAYEEARTVVQKLGGELAAYLDAYGKVRDARDKKLALEEKAKPLNALSEALLGKNPQKLAFETWALGMYFQQVVEFASRRFNDISDGRFSFLLKQPDDISSGNSQRGLDLLVLDSYTGRTRDAAELSGGETFEASISLALAITDVVQNDNGGGIQLDSLFIDEGFGTLDPETLEKAMGVLMELGETRMIGMISHVSELENFPGITSAISVEKGRQGSCVKLETLA